MSLFRYHEPRYYSFGLRAGVRNLLQNGFSLGAKRTIGKISQPINWYTRFPEYHYFDLAIRKHLTQPGNEPRARVLDLGSPKTFGLYLASTTNVEVTLTDISELNVEEYRLMWNSIADRAKGQAVFGLQDARRLKVSDGEFDVVYSMSVVEHIQGEHGDSEAVCEMVRVLKPGGLLLLSVPFGRRYIEQEIVGLEGAVQPTHDRKSYFFQRIYDEDSFRNRILVHLSALNSIHLSTVWRRHTLLHRSYAALGHTPRGFLGFINPLISAMCNQSCEGIKPDVPTNYGVKHSLRNIYGDLIMSGVKKTSA